MNVFFRDPVLRLLPDLVPSAFLRLNPAEQAWRGRAWLIMYGAGYEPDHAWWFVMSGDDSPASAEWITFMKSTIAQIEEVAGDGEYVKMLQGRMTYEAGKAMIGDAVQ